MLGNQVVLIGILIYFLITMLVGVMPFGSKRIDNYHDFYSASKATPDWCFIFCMISSLYTCSTWTGWVPLTAHVGFFALYTVIYIVIGALLYWYIAPRVYAESQGRDIYALGGFLQHKLGDRHLTLLVSVISLIVGASWIIIELRSVGLVISAAFNYEVNLRSAIILGMLIIVLYLIWGGMESAIWSACMHGIVMLIGGTLMAYVLVQNKYGDILSFAEMVRINSVDTLSERLGSLLDSKLYVEWICSTITSALGIVVLPIIFSRMFMGNNERTQKKIAISIGVTAFWCITFIAIGYVAILEQYTIDDDSTLIFKVMAMADSNVLNCMTYIVMIAAAMGTIDIGLFSLSSIIMTTFKTKWNIIRSTRMDVKQVRVSRYVVVGIAIICTLFAMLITENVANIALKSYAFMCQVFPALACALFVKNPNSKVIYYALLSGILLVALVEITRVDLFLSSGVWGLLLNTSILIVGHKYVKRKSNL